MMILLRQLSLAEVRRPLDPIAELDASVRKSLEKLGIEFSEDDDPGLPSPSRTAAIELPSGSQFGFEHFYHFGERGLIVRATPGDLAPRERLAELQSAVGFGDDEIRSVQEAWW